MTTYHRFVDSAEGEQTKALAACSTTCLHVAIHEAPLFVVITRAECGDDDSDGLCQACYTAAEEAELNEVHTCHDCEGDFKLRDLLPWKPADATMEDEPILLCKKCRKQIRHLSRLEQNKALRKEMEKE